MGSAYLKWCECSPRTACHTRFSSKHWYPVPLSSPCLKRVDLPYGEKLWVIYCCARLALHRLLTFALFGIFLFVILKDRGVTGSFGTSSEELKMPSAKTQQRTCWRDMTWSLRSKDVRKISFATFFYQQAKELHADLGFQLFFLLSPRFVNFPSKTGTNSDMAEKNCNRNQKNQETQNTRKKSDIISGWFRLHGFNFDCQVNATSAIPGFAGWLRRLLQFSVSKEKSQLDFFF